MKRAWNTPVVEELAIQETAFGYANGGYGDTYGKGGHGGHGHGGHGGHDGCGDRDGKCDDWDEDFMS